MLLQASLPRPIVRMDEFPHNITILTLRRGGISDGKVTMGFLVDTETGTKTRQEVLAERAFPIDGETGFEALEYVVPVHVLLKMHGGLSIVYGTVGVEVFAQSAFRASASEYGEHKIGFNVVFPVTGGGIVRMWDSPYDLANPGFQPGSSAPPIGSADEEKRLPGERMASENLLLAFNRTHKVEKNMDIKTLRRKLRTGEIQPTPENLRSAGLDPSEADSYKLFKDPKALPGKSPKLLGELSGWCRSVHEPRDRRLQDRRTAAGCGHTEACTNVHRSVGQPHARESAPL